MEKKILIVDDEEDILNTLRDILVDEGYEISIANSGKEALGKLKKDFFQLVLADLSMPEMDGLELLKKIKSKEQDVEIIIMTGYGTIESAVECIKQDALDYFTKPFSIDELKIKIKRFFDQKMLYEEKEALEIKTFYLEEQLKEATGFDRLVGKSEKMKKIYKLIPTLSNISTSVLILGETGTGKELVARAIHYSGTRCDKPFIKVNCSSLSPNLLESELFGHEKGAFTGAVSQKKGRFEIAEKGTIFLDEIADIPLDTQIKLLRFLDDKGFERVGGEKTIYVDARVITATNRDLKKYIEKGIFREDLYHRLNVVSINLHPLRDKKADIPLLVSHFIKKYNAELKKDTKGVTNEVMKVLMNYDWPGNVRELKNVIERAMVLTKGKIIKKDAIPEEIKKYKEKSALKLDEKETIKKTLEECYGKKDIVLKKLNISRVTLWRKMKKYGLLK